MSYRSLILKTLILILALVVTWNNLAQPLHGAESAASEPLPVQLLSEACETELARSAAPQHLRDEATVFVLKEQGYAKVHQGTNPFTCIVNRDHAKVLKPTCFDAEGGETIVPKILYFGQSLMAGKTNESIQQDIDQRFEDGTFISPRRPGVAYMLSRYNRPYDPNAKKLGWFPPHVMFYAPDLDGDDIGFSMQAWHANEQLPWIGYQGPHGYMIMLADDGQERSRSDLPSCPDWVHAD